MCSEANPTEEQNLKTTASMTNSLQAAFHTAFGENQEVLKGLQANLQQQLAKPSGFGQPAVTSMRTEARDAVASQFASATRSAGARAAATGGADLGSGVTAQVAGQVGASAAGTESKIQSDITQRDAEVKNQNYWRAISGLSGVASQYNPTGFAGAATSSSDATTSAAKEVTAEQEAGWQNAMGIVSGVAGLASAGAGAFSSISKTLNAPAPPAAG